MAFTYKWLKNKHVVFKKTDNLSQVALKLDWGSVSKYCITISCNFLQGGVSECRVGMDIGTPLIMKLFRTSICTQTEITETWVYWAKALFMILRLFHSPYWLFLLQIWVQYFETITYIQTNLHLKATSFSKIEMWFQWGISSKDLKLIEDVCPSS